MGAPLGNQNASKAYRWKNTIQKRLEELQAIEKVADALITKALEGDMSAIKELGDRIDGKPKQQVDIGGQEDNPIISEIQIRLVKAGED